MAESFHNTWLLNMPDKKGFDELYNKQQKADKYFAVRELVIDDRAHADDIAW